jgi:E3 ubiquitin-protein ligase MYCBP2
MRLHSVDFVSSHSNPQDSESQQTSKAWAELQACKCTLSMTAAIVQRCNDLMALALERAEDQIATEVLGNACIITTLLPLVLANISPLATLDPRVSDKKHYSCVLLRLSHF